MTKMEDKLQTVKGVGPKISASLASMGLNTVADLVDYWPRRYDDYSAPQSIVDMRPGLVTIKGKFTNIRARSSRRGLHMTEATLSDASGKVKVVWFNQRYRAASLKPEVDYFVSGQFDLKASQLSITNPKIELATDMQTGSRIVPIYRESKDINSASLSKITANIADAFGSIAETLPEWVVQKEDMASRALAIKELHLPSTPSTLEAAKKRLSFEEVFQMQLAGELMRRELATESSERVEFDENLAKKFVSHLPYTLTGDQKRTIWQIYKDMDSETPMNRLVEGDVGSGKTVVAAMAAIMAMNAGYQVLFMAPTEILARQHAISLAKLLECVGMDSQVGLLVGSLSAKQKSELHARIASGDCRLAVGTNALIQDKVAAGEVGLVIIDEQHRFGVDQRTKLRTKAGLYPHVLCMTATPIPRTLALTLYGELDTTQLREMPPGRTPIVTELVEASARSTMYKKIDESIAAGRQAFIVCPLIEDNPELGLVSAEEHYDSLKKGYFKHRKLALLHGGMKPDDKNSVMADFKAGDIDLLVATTVIEVGVDVPNATTMVVESAERFGLAQIHQLRGRVGRGIHPGQCFLVPSAEAGVPKRLRVLTYVNDGFRLSEIDLELRGPGAIYGSRQSGALDLRLADISDEKLVSSAKRCAVEFVDRGENLLQYSVLANKVKYFTSVSKLN
jgi:ATP-dependent DNA helicase RecG